ncbi:hypothetical protein FQ775_07115 [Nitratireductor mangrovi]|uniref:Uncharacterized protein n=1 Tax=Nitratireductor mangrovi TaxID=2599600 RepID=A0A5B8KXB4_9HYPH|nr:hypothetical protein [Nitratireductor mangrovi]QDZ00170.1 hypothetical protein FQ775_07115 [Nitratireductor mangrovi]
MKPPDDIIVLALRSISGEVTRHMRAIAFGYRGVSAKFRFYMESEPTEIERENAEVVATNFDAGHPAKLDSLEIEFVVTKEVLGKLNYLDFCIYRRSE